MSTFIPFNERVYYSAPIARESLDPEKPIPGIFARFGLIERDPIRISTSLTVKQVEKASSGDASQMQLRGVVKMRIHNQQDEVAYLTYTFFQDMKAKDPDVSLLAFMDRMAYYESLAILGNIYVEIDSLYDNTYTNDRGQVNYSMDIRELHVVELGPQVIQRVSEMYRDITTMHKDVLAYHRTLPGQTGTNGQRDPSPLSPRQPAPVSVAKPTAVRPRRPARAFDEDAMDTDQGPF